LLLLCQSRGFLDNLAAPYGQTLLVLASGVGFLLYTSTVVWELRKRRVALREKNEETTKALLNEKEKKNRKLKRKNKITTRRLFSVDIFITLDIFDRIFWSKSNHKKMKSSTVFLLFAIIVGCIHSIKTPRDHIRKSPNDNNQKMEKDHNKDKKYNPHYFPDEKAVKYKYPKFANFTKVIVPSVYDEFDRFGVPAWATDQKLMEQFGYSVHLYQKLAPNGTNYIRNRGTEGGVYLRYIVDHYHNFPDVAIFVHANPADHSPYWLERIGCINPNATYLNINFMHLHRDTSVW